jgi:choline-sulfatase
MGPTRDLTRREFVTASSAMAAGALLAASGRKTACAANRRQEPNILLIIADQMTPFLTGVYGHPVVKTPNLEKLAKRGVRFDAAYTPCPICAPARACLLTGKYSSHNGVYDNAAPLPCDEPTMCHYLNEAGYDTVLSGKAHFVGPDQLHGFRKRLIPNIYPTDFTWTKRRENKRPRSHARSYVGKAVKVDQQTRNLRYDEEAHRRATDYLSHRGSDSEPFFLCVSYNFPHEPFCPPKKYWDLYEDAEIQIPQMPADLEARHSPMDKWLNRHHGVDRVDLQRPESLRRLRRAYYALVTYIDDKVGELLASLEHNGLADDTVVVFTSDHGDMLCEKNMVQKRTFYEWSCRVPLIVMMPDGAGAGRRCAEPVSLIDLAPTILDLAGIGPAKRLPMDGTSLMGLIRGTDRQPRTVFAEMHSEGVYTTCFMVRRDRYKYNYFHGHGGQLFDLVEDPDEWNDLAGTAEHAAVENELRELILNRFDPNAIEKDLRASLDRRLLLMEAMKHTGVDWRYEPETAQ